jgi:hypothetical protein
MTQPLHIGIIINLLTRPLSLKECSVLSLYFKNTWPDRYVFDNSKVVPGMGSGWFIPSYRNLMEAKLYTIEYMN